MPPNTPTRAHSPETYSPNVPADLATLDADQIIAVADNNGREFARMVKTNQLRNVFAHIVEMRTDYRQGLLIGSGTIPPEMMVDLERRLILLKPKLAYAKGRKPAELSEFYVFMVTAIDAVKNSSNKQQAFENFFALIEAVVAYHKFYGGKD